MIDYIVGHYEQVVGVLKMPVVWLLLAGASWCGAGAYHLLHQSELRELQLKAERLSGSASSEEMLGFAQTRLLDEVWKFQQKTRQNKTIVTRDGEVFDDDRGAPAGVNLIRALLGKEPSDESKAEFEDLILSVPGKYVHVIPETRLDSPFVLRVTEDGHKKLVTGKN